MPWAAIYRPFRLDRLKPPEATVAAESNSRAAEPAAPGKPPTGFGDIARRMTSRTTDLIAIAIVAVASLTFGRQILHWWHTPPSASPATGEAPLPRRALDEELQPI